MSLACLTRYSKWLTSACRSDWAASSRFRTPTCCLRHRKAEAEAVATRRRIATAATSPTNRLMGASTSCVSILATGPGEPGTGQNAESTGTPR